MQIIDFDTIFRAHFKCQMNTEEHLIDFTEDYENEIDLKIDF